MENTQEKIKEYVVNLIAESFNELNIKITEANLMTTEQKFNIGLHNYDENLYISHVSLNLNGAEIKHFILLAEEKKNELTYEDLLQTFKIEIAERILEFAAQEVVYE